jgi:excisionase family DNA binding protein
MTPATIRLPTPPLLVSAADLAELLAVSVATIRRWDAAGRLPQPVRIGGAVRWRTIDVTNWLAAGCPRRNGGPA